MITLNKYIPPMKSILLVLFVTIASVSYSQTEVNAATIKDHIGDSVKYCGKVATARLMEKMNNAPAFLNIDGAYPNQVFTVVIWKPEREKFAEKPETFYLNKQVCIYGKVELFREQIQMVVRSESQIVVQ